jgi:SOS-response transcriptional repressor LexA
MKLKTFGERLREAREAAGLTQDQVGNLFRDPKTGKPLTRNSVANWELDVNMPEANKLPVLSLALKVSVDFLFTGKTSGNTEAGPVVHRVPIISWVQAGNWASVVDNFQPGEADAWAETTSPPHRHTYALRVRGDSMTNPNGEPSFPDGQIIIVEPDAIDSADRMIGALLIVRRQEDDEATFKKLVKDGGKLYLRPLNPQYPMMELREGDVVCGVVREKNIRFF